LTDETVEPQLIRDFTAFDTSRDRQRGIAPITGNNWVGDLAVACTADVQSDSGTLCFELRKGGRRFHCHIDVATGRAMLSSDAEKLRQWRPAAATAVRGRGSHDLLFSNCDNELRLWVDGRAVAFDAPTTYLDLQNHQPIQDDEDDLAPVGVGSAGARVRISHLRVLRDIYYIADQWRPGGPWPMEDSRDGVTFPLQGDRFFMLGDNSSNSSDARLWGPNHYVTRDLLIGKAFFLYWPHSWNEIPTPWGNVPCPYFPNFRRMGFVR
jgi:signal peptidase I